jgi:predicted lipoprotein with Yx(FWY)xxD motif
MASGADAAAITVSAVDVSGLGAALVNGTGRTLYVLSSEQGGMVTCTDDNGCTKVWPDTELPSGTTHGIAGAGVQASLLGTTKNASGDLYLTYGGYPLYTFTGDTAPDQANGQGITSFGGTWSVISPTGMPVNPQTTGPTSTTPAVAPMNAPPQTTTAPPANTAPPETTAPPSTAPPETTAPPSTAPPSTAPPTTTPPPTTACLYPPCY